MFQIAIISSSVRTGRRSNRVVKFFKRFIETNKIATVDVLDLNEFQFPIFDERLHYQPNPTPGMLDFSARIKAADGVLIVTPEYNGGYPASLKNVIDLLYDEWHRKPIAISTVSDGIFGGSQVITALQFTLWKIRAWTVPAMFPCPKVQDAFDEDGYPKDEAGTLKRATAFIDELVWCMKAAAAMK